MPMTILSVLTPSYNYDRYMADALASVGEQGRHDEVEHVVVDDGSSDGSVELLRTSSYPIRWSTKVNGGLSDTLNSCLSLASGEWAGWLNADDYYLPGALDAVLNAIAMNEGADFIFG